MNISKGLSYGILIFLFIGYNVRRHLAIPTITNSVKSFIVVKVESPTITTPTTTQQQQQQQQQRQQQQRQEEEEEEEEEAQPPTRTTLQQQQPYNIECKFRDPIGNESLGEKKLECLDHNDPTHAGVRGEWKFVDSRRIIRNNNQNNNANQTTTTTSPTRWYPPNMCCFVGERNRKMGKPMNLCSTKKFGGWGNPTNYTGDPYYYQQMPTYACYCHREDPWIWFPEEESKSPPSSSSSTNPPQTEKDHSKNSPLHYNKEAACQLLGNRTVLLIGDSTMQQIATTLMNAFYKTPCAPRIRFTQGDNLIKKQLEGQGMNRGVHWKEAVAKTNPLPSIVVVGVGPHVHADQDFVEIVQNVTADMAEMQRNTNYSRMQFIWKTQHPGGCTHIPYPTRNPNHSPNQPFIPNNPTLAARSRSQQTYYKHTLFHNTYYDRDLWLISHVQDMVQQNKDDGLHMQVLDIRPVYSRSDKKVGSLKPTPSDCLHFCSPGPLDIVGPLFYQLLQKMNY